MDDATIASAAYNVMCSTDDALTVPQIQKRMYIKASQADIRRILDDAVRRGGRLPGAEMGSVIKTPEGYTADPMSIKGKFAEDPVGGIVGRLI